MDEKLKAEISVIVPVYYVEKYIHTCVESILRQTYENYEVILVDDGSPDGCPEICDCYAEKYAKVIAVHKKNGGLSDARNYGVQLARGRYVTFIDSDDYVSDDYLERLVELREKYHANICVGGIKTFFEGERITQSDYSTSELSLTGLEALEHMLYQDRIDTSACAMLLPIEVAKEHPFPIGKYHEDEFTTYQFYSSVERVAVTAKPIYFYLQRRNSIMHTFGQASLDELDAADHLVAVCEKNWPELVGAARCKQFSDYCQVFLSIDDLKRADQSIDERVRRCLLKNRNKILFNSRSRFKNKIAAISLVAGPGGLKLLYKALRKFEHFR